MNKINEIKSNEKYKANSNSNSNSNKVTSNFAKKIYSDKDIILTSFSKKKRRSKINKKFFS